MSIPSSLHGFAGHIYRKLFFIAILLSSHMQLYAEDCNCAKPKVKITATVDQAAVGSVHPQFNGVPIREISPDIYSDNYEIERDKEPAYELSVVDADVSSDTAVEFTFPHCTIEYRRDGESTWQKGNKCSILVKNLEGVISYFPEKIYLRITTPDSNSASSEQLPGAETNTTPTPSQVSYNKSTGETSVNPASVGHEIPVGLTQVGEGFRSLGHLVNYSGVLSPASWNLNSFYADGPSPLVDTHLVEAGGQITEKHIITANSVFRLTGWDAVNSVPTSYTNATGVQIAVYIAADYNSSTHTFNSNNPHSYYRLSPTSQGGMNGQLVVQSNFGVISTAQYLYNQFVLRVIKDGETRETTVVPPTTGSTAWMRQSIITRDNVVVSHTTENYDLNAIFDYALMSRVVDPTPTVSGDELVTFMQYDSQGRIQAVSESDGNWSYTEYESGTTTKVYSPWLSESSLGYSNGVFSLPTQGFVQLTVSSEYSTQTYYKDASAPGNGILLSSRSKSEFPKAEFVVEQQSESTGQGYSVATFTATYNYNHANEYLRNKTAMRWTANGDATLFAYDRGNWNGTTFSQNASGPHYRTTETTGVVDNASTNTSLLDFQNVPSHSVRTVSIITAVGTVREEQWICDGANSFSLSLAKDYEYETALPHRLTGMKVGGRYISKTEFVSPTLTRSFAQDGSIIETVKNANGQVVSQTAVGSGNVPSVVTTYSQVGNVTTTSTNSVVQSVAVQDAAGRTISQQDATGAITTMSYTNGGRTITTTGPGGVTSILTRHFDGRQSSLTGTGVVAQFMEYSVDSITGFVTTTQRMATINSPRFVSQETRWDGATVKRVTPNPDGGDPIEQLYSYASGTSRLERITSTAANVADSIYGIVESADVPTSAAKIGHFRLEGRETGGGDGPVIASTDRLTSTDTSYVNIGGQWYEQTVQKAYHTDNTAAHLLMTQQTALAPVAVSHGTYGNGLRWTTLQVGPGYTITSHTDHFFDTAATVTSVDDSRTGVSPDQTSLSLSGRMVETTSFGSGAPATVVYDSAGRVQSETTPLGATTRYFYNNAGQLETRRDHLNRETSYEYFPSTHLAAGKMKKTTDATGGTTEYTYNERGDITEVTGTATQRMVYEYNSYGERTGLRTWRSTGGTGDLTQWVYDPATGLLKEKIYADGKKTIYTYDSAGRVYQRTNARNLITTYNYNEYGENITITYPAGTANVTRTYDRLGREKTVNDASGLRTVTYHAQNGMADLISYNNSGALANRAIDYTFDASLRPSGYTGTGLSAVSYGYDTHGRLLQVTADALSHTYSYLPGTSIQSQRNVQQSGSQRLAETRIVDRMGRLSNIRTVNPVGAVMSMHGYEFDALDRRTEALREDGRRWLYGYNARGELESAAKFTADGASALPAHRYTYAYDGMGNLTNSTRNTGTDPTPVMQTIYAVNHLNQYTSIETPGQYTLLTEVPPAVGTADVTINGQYGQRTENIIHRNITVNNATAGVLAANSVVRSGTTPETITGNTWVPRNVVVPTYDFEGNLTNDGLWTYTWDAENRLSSMAMDGNAGYATRIKLDFLYDSENRRVSKAVSTTTSQLASPTWTLQSTTRFLYDGWNMIGQYSFAANAFNVHAQYVWGLDVNGAMQSAGGVGGLLQAKVIDPATSTTTQCLPCYDGNGNIMAWVDGANAALIERREYDSFGSMVNIYRLATNATLHGKLAYGFSTKWRDAESDLLYYGHRYYNPSTQRWLNRDLIEEAGGVNLYGFVENDPIGFADDSGLNPFKSSMQYPQKPRSKPAPKPGEGAEGANPVAKGIGQLTVPIRVVGGAASSLLTGDVFSDSQEIPEYGEKQCKFLITVSGIKMKGRSQQNFRDGISQLPVFSGIDNPSFVNNPSRYWSVGDFFQIGSNEIGYLYTVPDIRAVNAIEAAAKAAKSNQCKCWCITVVAHSQGTMIVKRALDLIDKETKKHISLIGLGGETSFGLGDGVASTLNIWEKDDPVPHVWNRFSPWNGNDDYHQFDDPNLSGIPAHSWEDSYLKYLKENPNILKNNVNCSTK